MTYKLNKADRIGVVRIVAIYAIFSSLWIYLSDSVLELLVRDSATMTRLSVFKLIVFISLSAFLLLRFIFRHVQVARQADERIVEINEALEKHNAELDAERAPWPAAIEGIADDVWISDEQG